MQASSVLVLNQKKLIIADCFRQKETAAMISMVQTAYGMIASVPGHHVRRPVGNVDIFILKQCPGLIKLFVYYFKSLPFSYSPRLLILKVECLYFF